ncbi:MAG: AraC family transcriptional regulator [Acidobacteriaceae bacterium]|nr:AraC family transcriptional regulator [Acidobacteriaceae bacterium]
MDPITDIFTAMRVENIVYGRIELTAPWGLRFDKGEHACLGTVARGNAWLSFEGQAQPIALAGGDCFCLFAQSHEYTLGDHPKTPAANMQDVARTKRGGVIRFGGGGASTTLLGGKFTFDKANSKPLTDLLPPFIHVPNDRVRALPLQQSLQLFAAEAAESCLGSYLVLKRLADILLLQLIREYVSSSTCRETGWLRALSDPRIGGVLRSMHEKIEQPWTVSELASVAGMSRSAFALRFKEVVGETPLDYLTRWRVYRAAVLLKEGDRKLTEIANAVGYDSDGSFNKTFKRIVGVTPGEYRRAGNRLVPEVKAFCDEQA